MKASNNHFLNKYSGLKPTLVFRSNTYFLVNSTQPYTGLQKGYHSNKQLKYSFCYEDGKLCRTELYDGNGQLRKKANYKDGQLHGEYEKYHGNGLLKEKANYKAETVRKTKQRFHEIYGIEISDRMIRTALSKLPDFHKSELEKPDPS